MHGPIIGAIKMCWEAGHKATLLMQELGAALLQVLQLDLFRFFLAHTTCSIGIQVIRREIFVRTFGQGRWFCD